MVNFHSDAGAPSRIHGRRDVLRLAAIAGMAVFAESYALAADFWNKKKPSEWTEEEIQSLKTKSPWAKKVDAEASGGRGIGGSGFGDASGSGGGGGGRGGGGGGGGRGGGGGGAPGGGGGAAATLEVVWQSAKPIMDAHKIALPAKLENHYVIAVTGIPQMTLMGAMMGRGARGGSGGRGGGGGGRFGGGNGRDGGGGRPEAGAAQPTDGAGREGGGPPPPPADPTAALRSGSSLSVKGKSPVNADGVFAMNNNATLLFGFPKDALPLTVAEKEADFELKLPGLTAKAKFSLKDMMYNGELAL